MEWPPASQGCVVYFDGDDVGARIELHLLQGEIDASAAVSAAVVRAVGEIAEDLRHLCDARIMFAAGDEILAVLPTRPSEATLDSLRESFERLTGLTISCGLGDDAAAAARNLRLAKLQGKNQIRGVTRT